MSRKIAYLTGQYPRATDTFIWREVRALRDLGIDVETCSIRRTGTEHLVGPEQREEAARTFHVLENAKRPLALIRAHLRAMAQPRRYLRALKLALPSGRPGLRGLAYQLFYFAEAAVLADHMRNQGVTHLHNHIAMASCSVAMLASELSGIPYSFTLHGPDIFYEPMIWRLDRKIEKAAFVACISDFCRSQAMAFSDSTDWDKLHIIHCGVDPDRYAPGNRTGNTILFVGRLAAVKGVPVLLDAFARLRAQNPDLTLQLVGDGPDRAALEAGAPDGVQFLGYKSQAEVAGLLADADLFVLPSFAEGVPVVLMEAMAAKLPVIATRIAGIPELVEDQVSGLIVPPGDEQALETAMEQLTQDAVLRAQMGGAGRAKVAAEFSLRDEAARLARLLETYANDGAERPERRP